MNMDKMENISKVIIIDKDSIADIVQNAVNIAFQTFSSHYAELKKQPLRETDDLTDVKGIADYTHYSVSSIYSYVQRNMIPCYRHRDGRRILFSKSEVLEWIKGNSVPTNEEIRKKQETLKLVDFKMIIRVG